MAETFVVNGTRMAAEDAVAQIVQNEMGNTFQVEALKAQAVATYTYIQYNGGVVSGVGLKSNVSNVVSNAVRSVLGEMVVDAASGRPILAVYHSSSAGVTNPAQAVWGRNVSNLVSVESPYDNDTATLTLSREKVESYVTKNLNVNLQDDPAEWFRILDYTTSDNLYVNNMMVGDDKDNRQEVSGKYSAGQLHPVAFGSLYRSLRQQQRPIHLPDEGLRSWRWYESKRCKRLCQQRLQL